MTQPTARDLVLQFGEILSRRRWYVILPALVIGSLTIPIVMWLPATYKATTLIAVEAQKVPETLVRSTVTTPIEDRLQAISEQILSRTRLERVIDKFAMYRKPSETSGWLQTWWNDRFGDEKSGQDDEAGPVMGNAVERMRRNIEIQVPRGRDRSATISISFSGEEPQTVRDVANELASLFIEENLKVREAQAEGTTEFLENELQQVKAQLEAQEELLRSFKARSRGDLPGQLEANLRTLDRLQMERQVLQQNLKNAEDRYVDLNRQLEATSASSGDAGTPAELERRLQALRGRLANLRAEFREEYPDILIVKKEIAVLEAELKTVASTDVSPSPSRFPATNPLVGQLAEQLREINAIKRRQESTAEQIRVYEKRVENTPYREQQLTMLLRDYENVQRNYQGLLSKRQEAKISESLERRQKAEIFRILDPALLPQRPDKPNRPLLILLGLCGGLAAGLGLAFVREQMDPAIQSEGDLVAATTGLPLLAVIPLVKDGRVRTPRRDALSATGVGSKR